MKRLCAMRRETGRLLRLGAAFGLLALSAACATTGGEGLAGADIYEEQNRAIHAFNKGADRVVLAPVSRAYGAAVPGPVRRAVDNGVSNLSLPGKFVNHLLQGDVRDAGETFVRFGINTVFGLGGLLDPASDAGVYERDTDFGETMARWGVRQGAYLELPLLGPSSERDLAGRVVDLALDPMTYVLPTDVRTARQVGGVASTVNYRHEFRSVIESLLYESADSYMALRIAYLQNKAQRLGRGLDLEAVDLEDPYAFE